MPAKRVILESKGARPDGDYIDGSADFLRDDADYDDWIDLNVGDTALPPSRPSPEAVARLQEYNVQLNGHVFKRVVRFARTKKKRFFGPRPTPAAVMEFLSKFDASVEVAKIWRDPEGEEVAIGADMFANPDGTLAFTEMELEVLPLVAETIQEPDHIEWVPSVGRDGGPFRRYRSVVQRSDAPSIPVTVDIGKGAWKFDVG